MEKGKQTRGGGTLKIFFGYVPGVGKTCVMLHKKLEPSPDSPQHIQTHIGVGCRMMKAE